MDIELLRSFCLSLPAATESVKWGSNLVFSVGEKMFCIVNLDQPHTYSFKVPDEDFEALSMQDGFAPAPYMARAKWVLVSMPERVGKKEREQLVKQSYELIKTKLTKKLRTELGL